MKSTFSLVSTYVSCVLPEPARNGENKLVLHGLCSTPTSKMMLLQAVQIQLLSLHNEI